MNETQDLTRKRRRAGGAALLCALSLGVGASSAATLSYSDQYTANYPNVDSDDDAYTDWGGGTVPDGTVQLSLTKFWTGLGTLQSVTITLNGVVQGTWQVENESTSARTITGTLEGILTLELPSGYSGDSTLSATPSFQQNFSAGAYDGVTDFAGTSGNTYSALSASASSDTSSSVASDLALFSSATQGEALLLSVGALGQSYDSGGGNLTSYFDTYAGAEAVVTYTYQAVPEPADYATVGGLLALGAILYRRRRQRKTVPGA